MRKLYDWVVLCEMAIDSYQEILQFGIDEAKIISVKGSNIPIDEFFSVVGIANLFVKHQFLLQIQ